MALGKRIPSVLYHYCGLQTFQNIIENRSIWLSDISKSNDAQELKWMQEQCTYYILDAWLKYVKDLENAGKAELVQLKDFEQFDRVKSCAEYPIYSKTWAFCLTEKQDDLGQWRGYADDGAGVAIGFKSDTFEAIEAICHFINREQDLYFKKVRYSAKEIKSFFYEQLRLKDISVNCAPDTVIKLLEKATFSAIWNAPFFKNSTFKEEKEWRLAFTVSFASLFDGNIPGLTEKNEKLDNPFHSRYGYIVKNQDLVSHIEIGIDAMAQCLSSITIGPKSKLKAVDLKLYLISQGILKDFSDDSIKIYTSGSTYR